MRAEGPEATTSATEIAETPQAAGRRAGLAVRLSAFALDAALVGGVARLTRDVLGAYQRYVSLEAVFLVLFPIYSVSLGAWRGATVGKDLCGLKVRRADGRPIRLGRSLARETVGRLLATVPLGLGLVWIGLGRARRGWHDRLAGTCVTSGVPRARTRVAVALGAVGALAAVAGYAGSPLSSYWATRRMAVPSDAPRPWRSRDPASVREVATLDGSERQHAAAWLDQHGQDPLDYLVARAASHQVVLLGEMHEQGDTLRWLNGAIPSLFAKAGVTCIAMEVCLAEDNPALARLVGGPTFDRDLAMEIARHQPSGLWGWKEYWDVLETVWRVNHDAPAGTRKLRLIGLDKPMDVPSMVMMGMSDMRLEGLSPFELLRAWRVPRLAAVMMLRDGAMAREVEEQVLETGERAVVLVGKEHASLASGQPVRDRWGSMGRMLRFRYGDAVFPIRLHSADIPATLLDGKSQGPEPSMATVLEEIMARRGKRPVGFDVGSSPLSLIRDGAALDYHGTPGLCFADTAMGYVYLEDWREIAHCTWLRGYVSVDMFNRYKPMYEAVGRLVGVQVSSVGDMDEVGRRMER